MFDLNPLQKYHIIDAYQNNGMEAVLALLSNSVDQSNSMAFPPGSQQSQQMEMGGEENENPNEESFIEHEGKKYQRIQIEGLEAEEGEYLMDDQKNIYSLDFNFITNMNNEQIEGEDDD